MKTITMPQDATLVEAGAMAAQQGCILRAANGRVCMVRAQSSLASAMRAVDQGRFDQARSHLSEVRKDIEAFVVARGVTCQA